MLFFMNCYFCQGPLVYSGSMTWYYCSQCPTISKSFQQVFPFNFPCVLSVEDQFLLDKKPFALWLAFPDISVQLLYRFLIIPKIVLFDLQQKEIFQDVQSDSRRIMEIKDFIDIIQISPAVLQKKIQTWITFS
jgi:hypothetical protein